jgi:hypothetical protein
MAAPHIEKTDSYLDNAASEAKVRKEELEIKRAELEIRRKEASPWRSGLVTFVVALITLVGTYLVATRNNKSAELIAAQERQHQELMAIEKARNEDLRAAQQERSQQAIALQRALTDLQIAKDNMASAVQIARHNDATELELQRRKAQSDLILEAIKTGDPKIARANLRFFLQVGFVDDKDQKISRWLNSTEPVPTLPPSAIIGTSSMLAGWISKRIEDAKTGRAIANAKVNCETHTESTVTDASGYFSCSIPRNLNSIIVEVMASGYQRFRNDVDVHSDEPIKLTPLK